MKSISEPGSRSGGAIHAPLTILFEDEHLVAIDKPPGLLVHRSKIDARATEYALQQTRDQLGFRVWPIHRLDKPTSGILLFARDPETARLASDLFADRSVEKTYTAIVRGWTDPEGRIDYPLKEIRDKTTDGKVRPEKPAQDAVTSYITLATTEIRHSVGRYSTARYARVEVRPKTGRKNQIRRHFKHIFHPVIGDWKFGDRAHNAFFRNELGVERMLLAASGLAFPHPVTGIQVHITARDGFPSAVLTLFADSQAPPTAASSSSSGSP
ncbi:MAG: pseudouridine synthase [Bacteroidetes bacterium]|nr:pseudouridine synthase [Bacteroidota bacterium]